MERRTAREDRRARRAAGPERRTWRRASAVLLAVAAALTLTACPERQGPAEEAGESVDEAVDDMKDAVDPDGPAENLGERLDDATD